MRESKADFARRVQRDNDGAASIETGATADTVFGKAVLGGNAGPGDDGWDLYEVNHSGYTHCWSSASVLATFGR